MDPSSSSSHPQGEALIPAQTNEQLLANMPTPLPMTAEAKAKVDHIVKEIGDAIVVAPRHYEFAHALSVYFEADDTKASEDVERFSSLMQNVCGLGKPQEIKLGSPPGYKLNNALEELQKRARDTAGRSLIIVFYAGHGMATEDGFLELAPTSSASDDDTFVFNVAFFNLWSKMAFARTDILFIVDCCEAEAALQRIALPKKEMRNSDRILEVITACQKGEVALASGVQNTFTSRLLDAAIAAKKHEQRAFKPSELVQKLKSVTRDPTLPHCNFHLEAGPTSIALPVLRPVSLNFPNLEERAETRRSDLRRRREAASDQSVISVDDPHEFPALPAARSEESTTPVDEFAVIWYTRVSSGPGFQRRIDELKRIIGLQAAGTPLAMINAYQSASKVVFFQTPWAVWMRLERHPHYYFVCNVMGPCLPNTQAVAGELQAASEPSQVPEATQSSSLEPIQVPSTTQSSASAPGQVPSTAQASSSEPIQTPSAPHPSSSKRKKRRSKSSKIVPAASGSSSSAGPAQASGTSSLTQRPAPLPGSENIPPPRNPGGK